MKSNKNDNNNGREDLMDIIENIADDLDIEELVLPPTKRCLSCGMKPKVYKAPFNYIISCEDGCGTVIVTADNRLFYKIWDEEEIIKEEMNK